MNRPKVVVRAVASVDGRAISAPCAAEGWLRFTHKPEAVLLDGSELPGGDDWEPWPLPSFEGDPKPLYQDFLPDEVVQRPEHRGWFTVVDDRGRQRWAFKEGEGHWHLLVVAARHTPPEYLAYLRRENIPYLVAGEEDLDLRLAVEKLGSLLNVTCVLSTAAGELGGDLLHAGVIDDVNVEFSSIAKGGRGTALLFDSADESPTRLKLVSVQIQTEGRVRHRYQVLREGEGPVEGVLAAEQPGVLPAQPRATGVEEEASESRLPLPLPDTRGTLPLETAIARRRSIRSYTAQDLTLAQIGQFLWAAQGITDAEKGLRAAPSAGARYPLAFCACRADGVWRYHPHGHYLTRHLEQDVRYRLAEATFDVTWLAETPCAFAVCFISGRVCLSYGEERGWTRSLPMDCGHAAQNLLLQAVALGLGSVPVDAFAAAAVKEVLALPEQEGPLCLLPVGHPA
jgi:2,5-diamino-6-(ribosylamino)-4(3H)-pyrimidinone 5'-phosphate reductase